LEKYSEVVGLPVVCVESGKKLGIVKEVLFCPKTREVKAFLLERKGCQVRKKILLLKDVLSLGRDALVVDSISCVKDLRKVQEAAGLKDSAKVTGLRIYSKMGEDLGTVKDVLFDYRTGLIEGVEVSAGLLQDIVEGRNVLPLFGKVEFSDESILVDREAIEEMTGTGGGLKKFFEHENLQNHQ